MADRQAGGSAATDFEALARQYWQAWGETLRRAGAGPVSSATATGLPGWREAVDWWSGLARSGQVDADAAVDRFNAQARDWYALMQQVAAQVAGGEAGAAGDVAAAWRQALEANGGNPMADAFRSLRGQGAEAMTQWSEAVAPVLAGLREDGARWLGLPAFGPGREHQERLQALVKAQLDAQQAEAAHNALLLEALRDAHERFADKLAAHESPGRQLHSARALFDLWIDAAEEAYAGLALSPRYRAAYGAMVNGQMRLRQGVQREVERIGALFGMPTRTEVDAAHRKIAELERAVRALREGGPAATGPGRGDGGTRATAAAASPRRSAATATKTSAATAPAGGPAKPAASKSASKKPASTKRPAQKQPAPKQSASKQSASKQPGSRQAAGRTPSGRAATRRTPGTGRTR